MPEQYEAGWKLWGNKTANKTANKISLKLQALVNPMFIRVFPELATRLEVVSVDYESAALPTELHQLFNNKF